MHQPLRLLAFAAPLLTLLTLLTSFAALAAGDLEVRDGSGRLVYRLSASGEVRAASGALEGTFRGSDVRDASGRLIGRVDRDDLRDGGGRLVARLSGDDVRDGSGRLVYRLGAAGEVRRANGSLAARVGGYTPGDRHRVAAFLVFFRGL